MENKFRSLESIIRGIAEAGIISNPGAINTGHVKAGRSGYSSSADRGQAGGHSSAMKRVADQERETKKEQERSKKEMERQIDQRNKESEKRRNDLQSRLEETDPDRNSEERKKVKLVSRPDDVKPTDSKSKLARTAAYKTNVIDEEKPMFNSDRNFGLSQSLISAVKSVVEAAKSDTSDVDARKLSGKTTQVDLEPTTKDKLPNAELDSGATKKSKTMKEELSPKQKKIAAMAGDKGKIDAADFKALRSGKCSECGKKPCECSSVKEEKDDYDWEKHTHFQHGQHAAKEEMKTGKKAKHYHKPGSKEDKEWTRGYNSVKMHHEDIDLSPEELENLQAIAELFDEGKKKDKSVPSQTTIGSAPIRGANQDQSGFNTSGNVTDYTISDETIHEARGRPRKNPLPAGEEKPEDEHEHPIIQLRKIVIANGKVPFVHKNGEKTTMNSAMAQHGLNLHNKMKTPAEKEKFMHQIHSSHAGIKAALGG
jgi:hypothetical protein